MLRGSEAERERPSLAGVDLGLLRDDRTSRRVNRRIEVSAKFSAEGTGDERALADRFKRALVTEELSSSVRVVPIPGSVG